MSLYNDASLVMIPSAVKDGKLYSIRPTDGSGDFTFSRGSNLAATRVDVNGLIEKGRENNLLYSQDYTQTAWSKINCTITSNYIANPVDGSINAPNITIDQTAGSYEKTMIQTNLTFVSGNVYCVSVWMKAGSISSDTLRILAYDGAQIHSSAHIYLDDIANTPCKYEAGNDGWNRFYFYFKANNSGLGYIYIFNYAYGQVTNAGTNLYIYGAQWELGTYPTDYIESTTTTAVSGITEDLPRLDYSGGASCPSLLLEPQRTNAYTNSEYFDDWLSNRLDRTANNIISPEGVQNAYKMAQQSGFTTAPNINKGVVAAGTYTISIFAKKGSWNYLAISFQGVSYFNLEIGSKGTINSNHTATIEDYGNGWYRCAITRTTTTSQTPAFYFAESDNTLTTPDTQGYMYTYGAQLESNASYVSSYIPTYGSAVTRSQDVCVSPSLTTSTNFTIFFEAPDFCLINGTTGVVFNNVQFAFSSNGSAYPTDGSYHIYNNSLYYWNGSVFTSFGVIYNNQTDSKFALMKRGDSMIVFANGVKVNEVTLPSGSDALVSNWDTISLTVGGLTDAQGDVFKPNYKQLLKFDTALTDSEAIALTQ